MPTDARSPSPESSKALTSRFEDEADRAAARAMRHIEPGASSANVLQSLDRHVSHGHHLFRGSRLSGERGPFGAESPTSTTGSESLAPVTGAVSQWDGQPLPSALGRQMSTALGADLSGVRIHSGKEGSSVSGAHDALAVATGRDVYFAEGMYKPEDRGGRALLAHELAHTVQQGAVPTAAGAAASGLSVGGSRLAGPQRSGNKTGGGSNTGSQTKQLFGGFGAALTHVTGTQPKWVSQVEPTDPNRQELGQMLKSKEGMGGEFTQDLRQMMMGQNGAQTLLNQPMPKSTIPLFEAQLDDHVALDKRGAPQFEHHDVDIGHHENLSKKFASSGYPSGKWLHQLGKKNSQFQSWNTNPETGKRFDDFYSKGGGYF